MGSFNRFKDILELITFLLRKILLSQRYQLPRTRKFVLHELLIRKV